jgi:nitrogen-specific signal transduction histidine kinase
MARASHEKILKVQNLALEKLATGQPLSAIFDALTMGAEQHVDDAYASILLLDKSGNRLVDGSSPSFTQSLRDAFNGMIIGPLEGSCGTAAFSKQLVIVEDISSDPRWAKFKDFAHSQGLKSCFSGPILGSNGCVHGTFALTFTKSKSPTNIELEIIRSSSHIASLAIERKRYEENLQIYAKELEDFSSIASHDLQEPLRKIVAFGDRLQSRISDSDEQSRNYLERMQSAAIRMRNLIDDLLQFSKIEANKRTFEIIDLNELVENVMEDLETRIKETKGKINLNFLPAIEADPVQMHQLFLNLIGNALKFHREGVSPIVNLNTTCEGDGRCIISVEDNGIGIEEEHVDKIFKPFERLHGRSTYEGTGIGLTICNKIVARHGGEIMVKRQSNGVTFHVILPEKQK